jgi:hypothetical protein
MPNLIEISFNVGAKICSSIEHYIRIMHSFYVLRVKAAEKAKLSFLMSTASTPLILVTNTEARWKMNKYILYQILD